MHRSEVREAAGIFFVFVRNEENRLLKFVIAEFLKCDSCCDRGENGDVCEGENDKAFLVLNVPLKLTHTHTQEHSGRSTHTHIPSLTGKPGGSFI